MLDIINYLLSIGFILLAIIFTSMIIFLPERFFYTGYFKLWRRLHAKWRGRFDYFRYKFTCSWKTAPFEKIPSDIWYLYKNILFWLPFLYPAIMILFYKVEGWFTEFWFLASVYFFYRDFYKNNTTEKLNAQYTEIRNDPESYKNLTVNDGSCMLSFGTAGDVCVSPSVNEWLMRAENIGLHHCKKYEIELSSQIYNKDNWENIYLPFLLNNYEKSSYFGYQFLNESKFGISCELEPGKNVEIHKTCYFDSFLTNIIPGRSLVRLSDGKIAAGTENFMPYDRDRVLQNSSGDVLRNIYRANEPGVSTLLILPDGRILFWRQNNFAMSSAGKIAPSGSGSADWDDCKHFLSEPDGFRKSVIHAMERELWEESFSSEGKISEEDFMSSTETRIIGHFRWLQKSGKYEFVGVTRFSRTISTCNAPKPCNMEITAYDSPRILTVGDALRAFPVSSSASGNQNITQDSLPSFMGTKITSKTRNCHDRRRPDVKITRKTITTEEVEIKTISDAMNFSQNSKDSFIEIKDYSVPCAMAVLYLRQLCNDYCERCPKKTECLSGNIQCGVKLEEAIFYRP